MALGELSALSSCNKVAISKVGNQHHCLQCADKIGSGALLPPALGKDRTSPADECVGETHLEDDKDDPRNNNRNSS